MNTGSAILIVGAIFLHLAYGLDLWVTVGLCFWGLALWLITRSDEKARDLAKQKLHAEITMIEAKTRYYNKKTELGDKR